MIHDMLLTVLHPFIQIAGRTVGAAEHLGHYVGLL
ncbi:hypothetical protein PMI40_02486 [Herbaspirillum sp. YR522]|nr:hypothetical protein PMI40_02486 [Herbaspirillum sp. YR522]